MWGTIAQILAGVAAAVVADAVVKETTGKHIHQHAYRWWNEIRDAVSSWIAENPDTSVRRFVARLILIVDSGVSAVVRIAAETALDEMVVVTTETVPLDQLRSKLPTLKRVDDEVTYRY